ncbi:trypsin-like peptidase domain-containing protein [Lacunimicrobium album]
MDSLTSFALMVMAIGGVSDNGASASKSGLLYFTTPGCHYCNVVAPSVGELQRAGYPVIKIDGSQKPEVASHYGIDGYPTFVLVVNGKEVERAVGAQSKDKLERMASVAQKALQESSRVTVAAADLNADASSYNDTTATPRVRQASASEIIAQGANGLERPTLGSSAMFPGKASVASNAAPEKEKDRNWSLFGGRKEEEKTAEAPAVYRGNNEFAASADKALERTPASHAAVRIRVQDQKGENFGSGAIIDSRYGKSVILTCGHVLRGLAAGSKVEVDVFADGKPKTYVAQVIDFDLDADVGLIAIPSEQQLPVALVAGTQSLTNVGSEVCSIGCSAGNNPTKENHQITAINKYNGPDNIECNGVPVQGRSGGGLFDRHQQIIGVCIAADPKDQRGLYCGLKPIHGILRKNKLGYLLGENSAAPAQESTIAFGEGSHPAPTSAPAASASPFEMAMSQNNPTSREPNMLSNSATSTPIPQPAASSWETAASNTNSTMGLGSSMPNVGTATSAPGTSSIGSSLNAAGTSLPADAAATLNNAAGSKLTIIIESPNGGQPQVVIIPAVSASFLAELQGKPTPGEINSNLQITSARKENPTPVMNSMTPAAGSMTPMTAPSAPATQNWPPSWGQPESRSQLPQTSGTIPYGMQSEMKKERPQQTGYYVRRYKRGEI